jgi:hypothetical protein
VDRCCIAADLLGMIEMVLALVIVGAAPEPSPSPDALWSDDGAVLEVPLAHRDRDRVDAGLLRIDRGKRVLTWEGAPADIGCALRIEASLDDVSIAEARGPGLVLSLKTGAVREMTLIPPAHFALLLQSGVRARGGISREEAIAGGLRNDDVYADATGSGAFGGPTSKPIAIPEAARRDTRAVLGVLRAAVSPPLGDAPSR